MFGSYWEDEIKEIESLVTKAVRETMQQYLDSQKSKRYEDLDAGMLHEGGTDEEREIKAGLAVSKLINIYINDGGRAFRGFARYFYDSTRRIKGLWDVSKRYLFSRWVLAVIEHPALGLDELTPSQAMAILAEVESGDTEGGNHKQTSENLVEFDMRIRTSLDKAINIYVNRGGRDFYGFVEHVHKDLGQSERAWNYAKKLLNGLWIEYADCHLDIDLEELSRAEAAKIIVDVERGTAEDEAYDGDMVILQRMIQVIMNWEADPKIRENMT